MFANHKLRHLKEVGDEDVKAVLDKLMPLFRYLQQKDVFLKKHHQHVAERIVAQKFVYDNTEKSFIEKLK